MIWITTCFSQTTLVSNSIVYRIYKPSHDSQHLLIIFSSFIKRDDDDDDIYSIELEYWIIIPVNLLEECWHLLLHEG